MSSRPIYRFPEGIRDRVGRRLRPGSVVRITSGVDAGWVGEVVGWGGIRGLELFAGSEPPRMLTVDPSTVEVVAEVLPQPVTPGGIVIEESELAALIVHPVGAQEIQIKNGSEDLGPFPDPSAFSTRRGNQTKVDARRFGEACIEAVAKLTQAQAQEAVARWLDAPMLRRVLDETAMPESVKRLVFVVTDQADPHDDDTVAFGKLLQLWVEGTEEQRLRRVTEIAQPIVLKSAPHIVSSVVQQVEEEIERTLDECDLAVIVHAGGTPAMTYGTLLAYVPRSEVQVRLVQVPWRQSVIEVDVPSLVDRLNRPRDERRT